LIHLCKKHSIARCTVHAVNHKIKKPFFKNCLKSFLYSETSISQGNTDIQPGNTGYSLYSPGSGEVQSVASTKQGKHKFNIVHFLHNYSISAVLNTNCLHNVYLFLPHLSALVFDHLHKACCSFDVCCLYVNVFGNSLQI
jgi:hypothetical protein